MEVETDDQVDDNEHVQRLKAAIHYSVGQICDEIGQKTKRKFAKSTIATISELTFGQAKLFAQDLEHFAKHAKRSTITEDDVKLLVRRNEKLGDYIQKLKAEQDQQKALKKQKKKLRSKSVEQAAAAATSAIVEIDDD